MYIYIDGIYVFICMCILVYMYVCVFVYIYICIAHPRFFLIFLVTIECKLCDMVNIYFVYVVALYE